jgi:hypothetical protein
VGDNLATGWLHNETYCEDVDVWIQRTILELDRYRQILNENTNDSHDAEILFLTDASEWTRRPTIAYLTIAPRTAENHCSVIEVLHILRKLPGPGQTHAPFQHIYGFIGDSKPPILPTVRQVPIGGLRRYFRDSTVECPLGRRRHSFYKTHPPNELMERDKKDNVIYLPKLVFVPACWMPAFLHPVTPYVAYKRANLLKKLLPMEARGSLEIQKIVDWAHAACVMGQGGSKQDSQMMIPWRRLGDDVVDAAYQVLCDLYPDSFAWKEGVPSILTVYRGGWLERECRRFFGNNRNDWIDSTYLEIHRYRGLKEYLEPGYTKEMDFWLNPKRPFDEIPLTYLTVAPTNDCGVESIIEVVHILGLIPIRFMGDSELCSFIGDSVAPILPTIQWMPTVQLSSNFQKSGVYCPSEAEVEAFYEQKQDCILMEPAEKSFQNNVLPRIMFIPAAWAPAFLHEMTPRKAHIAATTLSNALPVELRSQQEIMDIISWTRASCVQRGGVGRMSRKSQLAINWSNVPAKNSVMSAAYDWLGALYPRYFPTPRRFDTMTSARDAMIIDHNSSVRQSLYEEVD